MSSHGPGRAEAPVGPAQRSGSQCAKGSSACGSIGNEQRRRLHVPAARDAPQLGRERRAPLGRHVLDTLEQ